MGYSVSWVAVRGKAAGDVLDRLGLRGTGEFEEEPESPFLAASLPGGWFLVFANRSDITDAAPLAELSSSGEAVTCSAEEHVMASSASGWRDGRRVWAVSHDAQRGLDDLEADGEPPPEFGLIRERLLRMQAERGDADYVFDIPIELAKAIVGFRHDEDGPDGEAIRFERLVELKPKPWWRFWA